MKLFGIATLIFFSWLFNAFGNEQKLDNKSELSVELEGGTVLLATQYLSSGIPKQSIKKVSGIHSGAANHNKPNEKLASIMIDLHMWSLRSMSISKLLVEQIDNLEDKNQDTMVHLGMDDLDEDIVEALGDDIQIEIEENLPQTSIKSYLSTWDELNSLCENLSHEVHKIIPDFQLSLAIQNEDGEAFEKALEYTTIAYFVKTQELKNSESFQKIHANFSEEIAKNMTDAEISSALANVHIPTEQVSSVIEMSLMTLRQ